MILFKNKNKWKTPLDISMHILDTKKAVYYGKVLFYTKIKVEVKLKREKIAKEV